MTIDFHCPGCQALVRVDGRAGGKKGSCPNCRVKLIIPARSGEPAVIVESAPEAGAPPVFFRSADEPDEPRDPLSSETQVALPTHGRTTDPIFQIFPSTSTSAGVRRKPRKKAPPVIPIVFGLLLVAGVAWMVLNYKPSLTGELTADVVEPSVIQTGLIGFSETNSDRAAFDRVRADLEAEPLVMLDADDLFKVVVTGVPSGLQISILPTARAKCVRVRPRQDSELAEYISDQAKTFNETRTQQMREQAHRFIQEWGATIGAEKRELPSLGEFRNQLMLASMVSGFGYHVAAHDGHKAHPCVSVGSEGELLFVIPKDRQTITLRGRSVGEGIDSFPGEYVLRFEPDTTTAPEPMSCPVPETEPGEEMTPEAPTDPTEPPPTEDQELADPGIDMT